MSGAEPLTPPLRERLSDPGRAPRPRAPAKRLPREPGPNGGGVAARAARTRPWPGLGPPAAAGTVPRRAGGSRRSSSWRPARARGLGGARGGSSEPRHGDAGDEPRNRGGVCERNRSALQIQCYQCEEFQLNNDCSSPEFIVNCTVNVQDMCQKEVMEQSAGIMYRKSCASSAACLIASAGYQSFCSPGKLNSVCISCCNTPLCNGPRPKKRSSSALALRPGLPTTILLLQLALLWAHC
ncbi:ly6/PLAUR domain-containing protein 1 isoform 1-T1 [Lycaon pictus]